MADKRGTGRRTLATRTLAKTPLAGMCLALMVVSACVSPPMPDAPTRSDLAGEIVRPRDPGPPTGPDGACWEADITPAIIETVTEQVVVTAEQRDADGTVIRPASYRTDTRQRIAREREVVYFRAPCPADITADFVVTLQRALLARGIYRGPLTGILDAATGEAIRRYQAERGLDSPRLSLAAAQELGLVSVPRDEL